MILKQLTDVTLADIKALAANAISEGRTLEFKAELPGPKDDDKREFLNDVTSFANTDGGDLIFGVTAKAGVAKSVAGARLFDTLDDTLLRLESLLNTCVQPRLLGARPKTFELPGGTAVILWRVPSSFAAPHRAYFKGVGRFYHRNSRGKAEMDTHELRAAFTASEGFVPRLATLHQDAVRLVVEKDLPFALEVGPRAILSILPLSVLREPKELDLDHTTAVHPHLLGQGSDWVHALEGFYVFGVSANSRTRTFALTRRTGQVDVSWVAGRQIESGQRLIWPNALEEMLGKTAAGAAAKLGAFGIGGPFAVALSLINATGFKLHHDFFDASQGFAMWRDRATLPILTADDLEPAALLPLARSLWYAMGEKRPDRPLGAVAP
jgi:hypothetical protein